MRPQEENHRRVKDEDFIARIGFSPWTNLAHLAGTATIIVALLTFGGNIHSTLKQAVGNIATNEIEIRAVRATTMRHDRQLSSVIARMAQVETQMLRAEKRSENRRSRIIQQLDNLGKKLDELNREFRDQRKN